MLQKNFLPLSFMMACALSIPLFSSAQVTINGPTCVSDGAIYLYNIQGNWDSTRDAKVCISGGILAELGGTCSSAAAFSYVKVLWSADSKKGVITLSQGAVQSSLSIDISEPLKGGIIDSAIATQILDTLTQPAVIKCSNAFGGNCVPVFDYQWQASDDETKWVDIPGATSQSLILKETLNKSMFYRRRVSESGSGSIGYSDVAIVIINFN